MSYPRHDPRNDPDTAQWGRVPGHSEGRSGRPGRPHTKMSPTASLGSLVESLRPDDPLFARSRVAYGTRMTRAKNRDRFEESSGSTAGGRAQPRPAFGLRPWFALLRRARSLRRFAFAIVRGSVPGGRPYRPGSSVVLVSASWRSPPIAVATSFVDRLIGMRRRQTSGLLLRSSSVHAAGLGSPLRVVHLDAEGTVLHQDLLTAGRRMAARGTWILELPLCAGRPDTGTRLTVLPSSRS